jgi:hypothetical protein
MRCLVQIGTIILTKGEVLVPFNVVVLDVLTTIFKNSPELTLTLGSSEDGSKVILYHPVRHKRKQASCSRSADNHQGDKIEEYVKAVPCGELLGLNDLSDDLTALPLNTAEYLLYDAWIYIWAKVNRVKIAALGGMFGI